MNDHNTPPLAGLADFPDTCGAVHWGSPAIVCALATGHEGQHEMPTDDGDGVWAWNE